MTGSVQSTVRRVGKTVSAVAGGQLALVFTQVLLPPAYLAAYGVRTYGEWLALSAGVGWLLTLDFGLQAFITNQLSLEYFKGDLGRLRQLQSVGLRISVSVVLAGLLLAGGLIWLVPLNHLLGLSMSREAASSIAICLVLQVLVGVLWGQLNGTLRSIGYPHRAENWAQIQKFIYFASTYALVWKRAPLWLIPLTQLVSFVLMTVISLLDLRRIEPRAFPTMRYWDRTTARAVLKPSLWFGSFTLNQFLLFQVPILVLNQLAGKSAVVAFSICRAYFGMVRQGVATFRYAIRPEITRLAGLNEWPRLRQMYCTCERISFTAGIAASSISFLIAPRLVQLWTRRTDLFVPSLYAAMMVCTIILVGKDTRLDLQFATNRHIRSARLCLLTYAAFAITAAPAARLAGAQGIVGLWIAAEVFQMLWLHRENVEVVPSLTYSTLLKLCLSGVGALAVLSPLVRMLADSNWHTFLFGSLAAALALTLGVALMFGLPDVLYQLSAGLNLIRRPRVSVETN